MTLKVAIVGRPNVGKSTLFNRLAGKRLAIVDDQPGVTRDRRETDAQLSDIKLTLIDTPGFEDVRDSSLEARMREQTEAAIREADLSLFIIDARVGVMPLDERFADLLRRVNKPVVVAANKCEGRAGEEGLMEAFSLGFGEPVGLSAEHGEGLAELYAAIVNVVPDVHDREEEEVVPHEAFDPDLEDEDLPPPPRTARLIVVGRPNAGKSTLINSLIQSDRLLTGPEAGITRDSIEIDWVWTTGPGEDRKVRLIDTAGMRKRAKVKEKLERLSVADARRAIDFAEVVVLLLDATKGLELQDLKIADHVIQEGRALVIAINKWDVAEDASALFNGIRAALDEGLAQLKGVPLIAVSAITGKGTDQMLTAAFAAREAWSRRVPTAALNRWFEHAITLNPPPAPGGQRIKLRYITQAKSRPPAFVIFGTRVDDLPQSYERYLLNGIRRDLDFGAVPVRLTLRAPKNPFDD